MYKERVERLPQQDRLIKICIDAGFLKTFEVGRCFMTEHTDEFLQFAEPVTCREYFFTKRWKINWPETLDSMVLEVTTSCLQGKYGVKIRIESVNKDNSHSWVRISHGLNKLVTDLSNKEYDDKEQETSETKTEVFELKTEVFAFASRSKAKAKPKRPSTTCSSSRTVPILERKNMDWYWTRISIRSSVPCGKTTEYSSSAWRMTSRRRWSDRILETERWSSEQIWALLILVWWCMEEQDGRRRRQQETISILYWSIRTRNSLPPSSSRSCRTQSHWSFITGQCVNSKQFLQVHLSHWMCSQFTLHLKFRIDSERTKF